MDMNNMAGRFTAQYGGAMPFAPQMPSFGGMPDPVAVEQVNAAMPQEQPQSKEEALPPLSQQGSKFAQLVADGLMSEDGIILKGKNAGRKWYGDKATQYIKENGGKARNLTPEQALELRKIAREEYTGYLNHPDAMKRAPTKFEHVNSLSDDYEKASKNYFSLGNSLGQLLASAKQDSAAGDMAMIFAYNKMLDPGSVVREGEFANAQNATGLSDRLRNMVENIQSGKRLSPKQRKEFIQTSLALFENAAMAQKAIDNRYRGMAQDYRINPERIIYNPYTGLTDRVNEYLATVPEEIVASNTPAGIAGVPIVPAPSHTPMPTPTSGDIPIPDGYRLITPNKR